MSDSEEVIEIVPMDEYDSQKAKLQASLSWILEKAYRENIPQEYKEPFYQTAEGFLHVKPRLANLMVTSELYCQACRNMFGDVHSQWQGHWSIIQVLSRKGIHVVEPDDTEVTETVLMKNAPFQQNAHLALIDCLMMAYISETLSVEKVVQAVRRFAVFNASSELPTDTEEAVNFWINKVCCTVQNREQKGSQVLEGESKMKVRIVSRTGESSIDVPVIDNFLQDIGDGCCLAVLIHFYCPEKLKLQDICLKSNIGIADSLYNLTKVKAFCCQGLPWNIFHLTYEDFLYTHNNLKQNLYALVADLFYWFEINRAPGVTVTSKDDVSRPSTAKHITSTRVPDVQISNVTKQSFKKCSMDDSGLHSPQGNVAHVSHKPLLPRRQMRSEEREHPPVTHVKRSERRSLSLSSPKERDVIQETMMAWEETKGPKVGQPTTSSASSNLLANVSIDSEMMDSFSDDMIGSLDIGDDSNPTPPPTITQPVGQREVTHGTMSNLHNRDHPDYMEVQSVTSAASRLTNRSAIDDGYNRESRSGTHNLEPLQPARLKPAKEKSTNHSKEQELSHVAGKKSPTKRDTDSVIRDSKSPVRSKGKSSESGGSISLSEDSSVTDSVTPLPEDMLSDNETSRRDIIDKPAYTAFSISGGGITAKDVDKSTDSVKLSYTIQDHVYTPETARAAGIPIVNDSSDKHSFTHSDDRMSRSHDGSVCSRNSGDFSDHESHKIHKDHKVKEAEDIYSVKKPDKLFTKGDKNNLITNFAEIRKLKQGLGKVNNSGLVYMQHGHETTNGEGKKSALRNPNSNGTKAEKKTTFAPTSSRTTWQETMQSPGSAGEPGPSSGEQPVPSELLQIRMKLEEKRKIIEKKKQRNEAQQQRLRQKLGKTAFLHVLKKPGETENGILEEEARSSSSGSFEDVSNVHRQDQTIRRPEQTVEQKPPSVGKEHSPSPIRNVNDEVDNLGSSPSQRAFSREGIQQTIENVRKRWFKDDAEVIAQSYAEKPETPDSPPPMEQQVGKAVPKSMQDYNTSLDKFDRNLSDLQSEIHRLSLQQEQFKQSRGMSPRNANLGQGHVQPQVQTSNAAITPHHVSGGPEISYNPQNLQHQQTPVGPVITSQNQYMPVTCVQNQFVPPTGTGNNQFMPPYNGYQQGFSPANYHYQTPQQQMFAQSPPYPVAPHGPLTSSPHTRDMAPAFSPMGPGIPPLGHQTVLTPSSHVGAQIYQQTPTQPMPNYQQTSAHSMDRNVPVSYNSHIQTSVPSQMNEQRQASHVTQNISQVSSTNVSQPSAQLTSVIADDKTIEQESSKNEFFISFNDSAPKPKPELGKNRHKSAPVASNQQQPDASAQNQSKPDQTGQNVSKDSNDSQNVSAQNTSGIGFVIGQDETSFDRDEADEIQRKKDKLIAQQLRRKEEQEKKRQYKEIEMNRRKEQERVKQEQADQRKLEEKLRREQIFRQYQEKKHKDDEEVPRPVVKRERSLRQKTRPQSMYAKANNRVHGDDMMHKSQEDLSPNGGRRLPPRSNTFHHGKIRKAVSCNQLTTSAEGKSLAFGGMTHRTRPPSPDLHGRGKMSASGSSEAGSMSGSGSEYSGPKLYVKPSAKSNKSIIHNAISHCCLAGSVNTTMKNKVLEVLEGTEAQHFMILFRDHSCQYRSLYQYYADTDFMIKLHGVGPGRITNSMIEKFYKYNSGGKKFTEVVSTKHLSVSIDAVVIHNSLWKSNKLAAKNK